MEARNEIEYIIDKLARQVRIQFITPNCLSGEFIYFFASEALGVTIEEEIQQTLKAIDYTVCQRTVLKTFFAALPTNHLKRQDMQRLAGELQMHEKLAPLKDLIEDKSGWCAVYFDALKPSESPLSEDFACIRSQRRVILVSLSKDELDGDKQLRKKKIIGEFFTFIAHNANAAQRLQLIQECEDPKGLVRKTLYSNSSPLLFTKSNNDAYLDYQMMLTKLTQPLDKKLSTIKTIEKEQNRQSIKK